MNTCSTCCYWSANQIKPEEGYLGACECLNPTLAGLKTMATFGCNEFLGADSTENNVPDHLKGGTMTEANPNKLDGPTEVLIISCAKDFDWLVLALRCATKYLSGFQGITVAHPNVDIERFKPLREQFDIRLHGYDEVVGKGMLQHFVKMAEADLFLPPGTKYVLTTDSDGMFHTPSTPENFAWNDKPYWIARTWESLISEDPHRPGSKVISDNMQWRGVTAAQLGFDPELFTMCVNCQMIPLDLLPHYRRHIEAAQGKPFLEYFLEGRNEFPQTRVDFNALGAYFYKFHRERFHFFDVMNPPFPKDRKKSYWSHGGLLPNIQDEIRGFLQ